MKISLAFLSCLQINCLPLHAMNKNNSTYHHSACPIQRNFDFSASFNAYYLAVPNNLLTHTHTHTHTHLAHLAFKRLHVRAREARVTLINKGLLGVPFVRIFVSLYEQKMNEIREQVGVHSSKPQHVVGTHGSCVRSPRVDELAVSGSLERTHEPCVPTCAMHTRKAK